MIREDSAIEHSSARDRLRHVIVTWSEEVMRHHSSCLPMGTTDLKFLTEDHAAQLRSMREMIEDHLRDIVARGIAEGDFEPNLSPHGVINTLLISLNGSPRWYRPRSGGSSLGYWQVQLFLEGLASVDISPSSNQLG